MDGIELGAEQDRADEDHEVASLGEVLEEDSPLAAEGGGSS
jgi:hypothetical protein